MSDATTRVQADLAARLRALARVLGRTLPMARKGSVRGIHQARVASRRLRELLPLLRVPGENGRALADEVRRLTRALGRVREVDVTRERLREAIDAHGWPAALEARLDPAWAASRERLRLELVEEDAARAPRSLARSLTALAGVAEDRAHADLIRPRLALRLRRRARRFVEALEGAGTLYSPDALHATRLAAKKLRYTLELVPSTAESRHALRRIERVQKRLGAWHDLLILQRALQHAEAVWRDRATRRAIEGALDDLEKACRARHAAFLGDAAGLGAEVARIGARVPLLLAAPRARRMRPSAGGQALGRRKAGRS